MHLTDYHAKYIAHELTKRCASDSVEKLAGALVDAQVDLNPHQVEAALFAFKSVRYTRRLPIVQPFTPDEREDRLYHLVSEYLQRDNLQALPASQRSLMRLVLRKLLASSTFAIAGALESLSRRLRTRLQKAREPQNLEEELTEDFEALDAMAEEWSEEETIPETGMSQRCLTAYRCSIVI